jgi:hypothetical protein
VKRSAILGFLLFGGWCSGLIALALWIFFGAAGFWLTALGLTTAAITGAVVGWTWQTSCAGELTWDGECWHWDTPGDLSSQAPTVSVAIDLQVAMLLLFDSPVGAKQWLWVERVSQTERWMDLRRAVFARRREPMLSASSSS